MTQAGTAPAATLKKITIAPLCSLEEARERFAGKYLDSSHVKLRLTESAQIVTPESETKFLFLKNVLPAGTVSRTWRTLRKLRFSPAKHSRRKALKTSAGGELLFGWIMFAEQEKGGTVAPMLTAATREQWPEFRNLWPLLWRIQHHFNQHLPEIANVQKVKAASAKESYLDYLFRVHFQEAGATYCPDRKTFRADLEQCAQENPEAFEQWFWETFMHFNPKYFGEIVLANLDKREPAAPGKSQGEAMMGYTVPGTMFSTITVNKSALFRCHADGKNLPGALACLSAFGNFAGGDLCFPRFGVSCPIEPGDLLIGDNAFEQHGNIGPLSGDRISIVAYMRDDFAK
jgi:hypothetical protein